VPRNAAFRIEATAEKFRKVPNCTKLCRMGERLFHFGGFVLDAERKLLLKDNVPVPVGHRGIALLSSLVAADGRPVSKADLMDVAWPAQQVEESNLSVQIAALRKALGVRPDGEDWIATVPRVGYRFLTPGPPESGPRRSAEPKPWDPKPSIAIMPFTNLSASREHEFFADGMTDDIIAALSRVGELAVAPRSAGMAAKEGAVSAKESSHNLGVRYILDGSVRAANRQVRVTAQLTDGWTGNSVWAERYEGSLEDIFAFQDDLTRNIVQSLQITMAKGESARLWEGQTRNLRAWEKAVQGLSVFRRYTTADNETARRLLEEAVALDPSYTGAMAWLGVTHHWDARYSLSVDRAQALAKAEQCIASIETLNPDLPQLFTLRSYSAYLRRDHDGAVNWGREAVRRAPGDSRAQGFLGMFQIYAGDMQGALVSFTHAMRHSPYPEDYLHYYLALVHIWLGNLDKALEHALEAERREPGEPYSAAFVAAARGFRGEDRHAKEAVGRLLEATPSFSLRNIRHSELYRDASYLERFCDVLRKAGLPD
jgi:TolB-like protein